MRVCVCVHAHTGNLLFINISSSIQPETGLPGLYVALRTHPHLLWVQYREPGVGGGCVCVCARACCAPSLELRDFMKGIENHSVIHRTKFDSLFSWQRRPDLAQTQSFHFHLLPVPYQAPCAPATNNLLLLPKEPMILCTSRPLKMPGPQPEIPFLSLSWPSSHGVKPPRPAQAEPSLHWAP